MIFSTQIHVLDEDSTRRAKLSYLLGARSITAQVYDSLAEFWRFKPQHGIVLLNDDRSNISIRDVVSALSSAGVVLPIALYAENPIPANIVEAILSGAVDYLNWPLQPGDLESALQRIEARAGALIERERNEAAARALVRSLSRRETEVLSSMVGGYGNKEIAQHLGISPRTVEIHRANLLRKLNAGSSAGALRIAIYAGLDRA